MIKHQPFDFTVVLTAPIRFRKKCPTDFDFADRGVIAVVAAGSDNLSGLAVKDGQSRVGSQSTVEELSEYRFLMAVADRVHCPNLGVSRGGEHTLPIIWPHGAELDERT